MLPAQGHAALRKGTRPSLSPLLTRHIAFNSGGARSERRPSLLGAQPLEQQQSLASPRTSQGFRKRDRFLVRTGSQSEGSPPTPESSARPVSSQPPAMGIHGVVSGPACQSDPQRHRPSLAGQLEGEALVTSKRSVASAGMRTTVSNPVEAPYRPSSATVYHKQPQRGAVAALATQHLMSHHPQQKQDPSYSSIPGHAAARTQQAAQPSAEHAATTVMASWQSKAGFAQGNAAAQRTHGQHIGLKEAYRDSKPESLTRPAGIEQVSMPGWQISACLAMV